jgi:hypothetical protein
VADGGGMRSQVFDLSHGMGHPHHPYAPSIQQMERSSCLSYEYLLAQEGNDSSDALTPRDLVCPLAPRACCACTDRHRCEQHTIAHSSPAPQRISTPPCVSYTRLALS